MNISHHPLILPFILALTLNSFYLTLNSTHILILHPPRCPSSLSECMSVRKAPCYFRHGLQEPIMPSATGNSFADHAVRDRGAREGFYTSCVCTMQLCQASQPFSSCGLTLTRTWQSHFNVSLLQFSHRMNSTLRLIHTHK